MKKSLAILLCLFICSVAQGQINPPPGINETELTALKQEFQELYQQKNMTQAVEKGTKIVGALIDLRNFKEASYLLYQMDQLVYENEKQTNRTDYHLRLRLTNQRLRLYTYEGKAEKSRTQLNFMHYCMANLKDENDMTDDLLLTEAEYYHTFGQTVKSMDAYKALLLRCVNSKDEKDKESCYKDMLKYAERKSIPSLTKTVQNLYATWQDSIRVVKAAHELEEMKQQHAALQQNLQEKEQTIRTNKAVAVGLWVLILALAAVIAIVLLLLFKSRLQVRKQAKGLQLAHESNAQKSHFVHNINTQITPTLDVMEKAIGNSDATRTIARGVAALKRRIARMQTYISLEDSSEEAYPVSNLDVKLLCETVMEKAGADFPSGVEPVVSAPKVSMKTNAEALEYILVYLLSWAASNTEAGKISLEFKKRNARTGQFIIINTGMVIDREMQETLFKPFVETEPLAQNSGWGLPICRLMAYKLNGTLKVDTEYKKGTKFVLDLCS